MADLVRIVAGLLIPVCLSLAEIDDITFLTVGEKRSLAKIDIEKLPESVKRAVDVVNAKEHWCCKIHPTKVVVNSRAVQQYIKQSTQHTNYGKCGLWGWRRCSRHWVTYYQHSTYKTVYSRQTIVTTCPDRDVVCCKGFLQVAHNCLPLSELPKIKDDLKKLKDKGVLVG
ncbi:uncharacterized protein LOC135470694 [Liolophura sinensis]|uniref:uncharacterized protein LOC135470694 n=1 Tax=Liolophura sinensis TaxID=3198878 RepID=UPI003158E6D5